MLPYDMTTNSSTDSYHRKVRQVSPKASPSVVPIINQASRITALNHSTLRANPFPEVTDLFCRLPLPTLFYRLEAAHLGDLMRL